MKKIWIGILSLSLAGCSLSYGAQFSHPKENAPIAIEKDAVLRITLDDKEYANGLIQLWNKRYPQHQGALMIESKPYTYAEHFQQDIEWISDRDVAYRIDEAYALSEMQDNIAFPVADHLQRAKDYFLPIEGRGFVFVYNEHTMKERKLTEKDIASMEFMRNLPGDTYYHTRYPEYTAPFVFFNDKSSREEEQSLDTLFLDSTYLQNITDFRRLSKALSFHDDAYGMDDFYYDGNYLCGLVSTDSAYQKSAAYRNGSLHFSTMPSWQGEQLAPFLDTYGFMVHKKTAYPKAASAFLQMVRSQEGMQVLLDHTKKLPLLCEDDLDQVAIFDHAKKEVIVALQGSQLRRMNRITEKPSLTIDDVYQNSKIYAILQNALYTEEPDESVWLAIRKHSEEWVLQQ